MTAATDNKVLSKIIKLMDKAAPGSGATEAEVASATAKVAELMKRYNVAMSTINTKRGQEHDPIIEQARVVYREGFQLNSFDHWLCTAVAQLFNVRCIVFNKVEVRCFGRSSNVAVAVATIKWLLSHAGAGAIKTYGKRWGKLHRDFCEGYASRIAERVRRILLDRTLAKTQMNQRYALVVRDQRRELHEWLVSRYNVGPMKNSRRHKVDHAAYVAGNNHAANVALTGNMCEGQTDQKRITL